MKPTDLVLCPLTLRKDLFRCSVAEYRSFLDAGVAAGYGAVSLALIDSGIAAAEGIERDAFLDFFRSRGLSTPIVEAFTVWSQGQSEAEIDAHLDPALEIAAAAGAETIVAICFEPTIPSLEVSARAFAHVCRRAGERGLKTTIEFFPWGAIGDIAAAWQLVQTAGEPNGGILLDTWHWGRRRAGPDFETLARIPGDRIHVVQLSDTAPIPGPEVMQETLRARLLPGEGTAGVVDVLRALRAIGARPRFAPEVFNHDLVDLGPAEMTRRVAEASRAVLTAAGWE
jgi:sugar phosphate isomerase/epimerase